MDQSLTAATPQIAAVEPELTGFDVFVLALSVLSIVNIILVLAPLDEDVTNVVLILDGVLCLVFLADFILRYQRAPVKRAYFIGDRGWLDLLGSLPFPGLRLARLFRMVRVSRTVRHYRVAGIWSIAIANRAGSALLAAVFLTIMVLQFGSMSMLRAEDGAADANIHSASDALWWSYVTVTTVGYGDRYPVTNNGRLVGIAMLTIGIGLFGVLTGFLANAFLAPKPTEAGEVKQPAGDLRTEMEDLRQIVEELRKHLARTDTP
jgi:hypothetical protein